MSRRLVSLLSILLFAQLTLVGGAPWCPFATGNGARGAASHAASAASPGDAGRGHGHGGHGPAPGGERHGNTPECASPTMCTIAVIAAARPAEDEGSSPTAARIVAAAPSPRSVTRVPELPPPRG